MPAAAAAVLLDHVGQQAEEAGARLIAWASSRCFLAETAVMRRRHDLAALGNVALQEADILVVDLRRIRAGEGGRTSDDGRTDDGAPPPVDWGALEPPKSDDYSAPPSLSSLARTASRHGNHRRRHHPRGRRGSHRHRRRRSRRAAGRHDRRSGRRDHRRGRRGRASGAWPTGLPRAISTRMVRTRSTSSLMRCWRSSSATAAAGASMFERGSAPARSARCGRRRHFKAPTARPWRRNRHWPRGYPLKVSASVSTCWRRHVLSGQEDMFVKRHKCHSPCSSGAERLTEALGKAGSGINFESGDTEDGSCDPWSGGSHLPVQPRPGVVATRGP